MDFNNKRVLVLGLGRSGLSAARILKNAGCKVWVSDSGKTPKIEEQASFLEREGIIVETGGHSDEFIDSKDLIIISPGINSGLPILNKAREKGIPVISEIELGFILCPAPVIAVTGTNGKTTVTTLIGMVIEKAGRHAVVCGNIGNSFTGEIEKIKKDDLVVLEVSSFQLENIIQFRPHIAVVLNITPDHLDRYASVEDYIRAKERIFINQENSDYAVLNHRDSIVMNFKNKIKAKTVYFNT
ncbi:MAG: UDP-N-acetylmuramoyl-L-alanine--D-glutamate ligase, partial [Candidatus Omnitrophica bacterium]|nr:UDP-N-acetylmuramoyl-L-alanine--D-glutamate ligase [Candidatus Omnitrophota bacterium]